MLFFSLINYAQIINIPDADFKAILLAANAQTNFNIAKDLAGNPATIDVNNDGEIQVSEALQISYISTVGLGNNVSSILGIEYFTNLTEIQIIQSIITNVDLSANINLTKVTLSNNNLTTIDLLNNNNINYLELSDTQITSLNLSNLAQLQFLGIYNLPITQLDFSYFPILQQVNCTGTLLSELDFSQNPFFTGLQGGSPSLTYLNIKNGVINSSISIQVFNSPNFTYLCCDENEITPFINNYAVLYPNCNVGSYCSFNPGGIYYAVSGTNKFDGNNNGCDTNDVPIKNFKFDVFNNGAFTSVFANSSGSFSIPVQSGYHVFYPILENPNYFNISPADFYVDFPIQTSPYNQDFCITPNGIYYDLEVVITRLNAQIPGADVIYKIIYKNKGNQMQSGAITLNFNDAIMDFVSSNPMQATVLPNQLTWSYANLNPFETREIEFIMNLNSPMETPALNSGDRIDFTGNIQPANTAIIDDFPDDNNINVNFGVVNSADPNDITCLEGNTVGINQVGKYVHYMIRFENVGTANATNIVVKNNIDISKFDVESLIPLSSNYNYSIRKKNNQFEFIFENINLPFDDANNDGYLVYKIKLKDNLTIGTTFTNQANIYFDFNFPIITNVESTTVSTLSNSDFQLKNIVLSPNPTSDIITIQSDTLTNFIVEIYDLVGKKVGEYKNQKSIKISNLNSGIYLFKILDINSKSAVIEKIIKR